MRVRIEYVPIERLKKWDLNPRLMPPEQTEALRRSLEHFDVVEPLVIDQHNRIVGGHQRFDQLQALGVKLVPCIRKKLTPTEFKALNLALNKIHGEWDLEKLASILVELKDLPEIDLTGFQPLELDKIIQQYRPEDLREDVIPEPPTEPITKTGDIWLLGKHRILCGDARYDLEKLMEGNLTALILTDPPYTIKTLDHFGSEENRSYAGLEKPPDYEDWIPSCAKLSRGNAGFFMWEDWRGIPKVWNALETNFGLVRDILIWHVINRHAWQYRKGFYPEFDVCMYAAKNGEFEWHFPETGKRGNVYESAAVHMQDPEGIVGRKPVELLRWLIDLTSSRDDIILDPFLGSGSTLIASEAIQRICYATEIVPAFVDVAIKRWETYTGLRARKLGKRAKG